MTRPAHLPTRWLAVIDAVCAARGVHRREILSGIRTRRIIECRHAAWWALRVATGASLKAIGWRFGEYDHTTVLNGIRKHCAREGLEFERTRHKPHRDSEVDTVRRLFYSGAGDEQIVDAMAARHKRRMSLAAVRQMRRKIGLKRPRAVLVNGKFAPADEMRAAAA